MTTKDAILTDEERAEFESKVKYWFKLVKQEDTDDLVQEYFRIREKLGVRVLFIIARYLELTEDPDK